ncbi:MAG: ABC transporter permease [Victivallaceae bacterium]
MNEIWKIWALDFRRQRAVFLVIIPLAIVLELVVFYGGLTQTPREILMLAIVVLLPIAGYLVSADVWARDFRERTVDFYLALPVADGRVFFARYLSSFAVFALFIWLPLLLIAEYEASESGQLVISHLCGKVFHLTNSHRGRFFTPSLLVPVLALLLLIHTMQINWTLGLRGDKGLQAGFLLTPLALLALWPATVWLYTPELWTVAITNRAAVSFPLIASAFFLLGGFWLWTRGVGRGGRTGWMLVKLWSGLIALSLGAWVLFYAIEIPSYLVTLKRFEHTPGIDIVRGPQRVPEVIQNFRHGLKLKPEELAAADFSKSVEITAAAYPEYLQKRIFSSLRLKKAIDDSLLNHQYELAAKLIGRYREMPDLRLPQLSIAYREINNRQNIGANPMTKSNFNLSSLKFPLDPDALPFYRAMERILMRKAAPPEIKIIRLHEPENPITELDLAANLPGLDANGWKRIADVLAWVCKRDWGQAPFRGAMLRSATATMKHWIALSEYFRQLATRPPEKLPVAFAAQQENPVFSLWPQDDPVFASMRDHFFLLPYVRLQQYALEHGMFPESPGEMIKPGTPDPFQLEYCWQEAPIEKFTATPVAGKPPRQLSGHSDVKEWKYPYRFSLPLIKLDAKGSK